MKTQRLLIWFVLMIVGAASVFGAANTMKGLKPASSTVNKGTITFSVNTTSSDFANCTWSTTAHGQIGSNKTTNTTFYTVDVDTSTLSDVLSTTLTATCTNASNHSNTWTTSNTALTFDNTAPSISCRVNPSKVFDIKERIRSDCTATTDTHSNSQLTWRHKLTDPGGSIVELTTGADVTFRGNDIRRKGTYTLIQNATDPANNTATTSTLTLKGKEDEEMTAEERAEQQKVETRSKLLPVIALIVVLVVLGGLIIVIAVAARGSKKKSKK